MVPAGDNWNTYVKTGKGNCDLNKNLFSGQTFVITSLDVDVRSDFISCK